MLRMMAYAAPILRCSSCEGMPAWVRRERKSDVFMESKESFGSFS